MEFGILFYTTGHQYDTLSYGTMLTSRILWFLMKTRLLRPIINPQDLINTLYLGMKCEMSWNAILHWCRIDYGKLHIGSNWHSWPYPDFLFSVVMCEWYCWIGKLTVSSDILLMYPTFHPIPWRMLLKRWKIAWW
jgi:hypothetical protein